MSVCKVRRRLWECAMFYSSTLGRDCCALFQPRRWPTPSSVPGWGSAPRGRPHSPLGLHAASCPRAALWPEGRRAVGPVCGASGDTWDSALAPTLPAFRKRKAHDPPHHARISTAPEPRHSRLPECVRAFLSFHWAQWPSIMEVGGRACALSAAIATDRLDLASAAEGEGGCCPGAGRDTGRGLW